MGDVLISWELLLVLWYPDVIRNGSKKLIYGSSIVFITRFSSLSKFGESVKNYVSTQSQPTKIYLLGLIKMFFGFLSLINFVHDLIVWRNIPLIKMKSCRKNWKSLCILTKLNIQWKKKGKVTGYGCWFLAGFLWKICLLCLDELDDL